MVKTIFISCGELSGEQHALELVKAIKKRNADVKIYAFGSTLLQDEGVELIADYKNYSFSGLSEVIKNLGKIMKVKNLILKKLVEIQPEAVVLIDYGGFNLELAKNIHHRFSRKKINRPRILEFIAPQIWASRPWRINKIKKYIDKVLCTLPFEEKIYRAKNISVKFVGNPVLASLQAKTTKEELYQELNINTSPADEILIGLFPGSRISEIKYMYPLMQNAALELSKTSNRKLRFLLAKAPNLNKNIFTEFSSQKADTNLITILDPKNIPNLNHKVLSAADCLWLCSGTVTLEAAFYETPYFLSYKSTNINYFLYLMLRITSMAGLANIISGKYIVKEFLQYQANVGNFVNETKSWLTSTGFSDYYYKIKKDLNEFNKSLAAENTFELTAKQILKNDTTDIPVQQ